MRGWESFDIRDPVERLDIKLAKQFDLQGYDAELGLAARNVLGKYEEMEVLRPKSNFPELNEVDRSIYATIKVQVD